MASDDKIDIVDKKSKKDKKSEKRDKEKKLGDSGGVVKDKKDKKKDKKDKEKLTKKLEAHLDAQAADATALVVADSKPEDVKFDIEEIIQTAEDLVPFALPLADDKTSKKLLKLVKKAAKLKAIHRGVKECEKALKKSPIKTPASNITEVPGLVIIAGDISPMEVIMHFPILCEEHNVPYFFVKSRAELGVAASTKRATSVVMLKPEGKKDTKGAKSDAEDGKVNPEEYLTAYKELVKIAQKEWDAQVHPFVKGIHPLQIQAKSRA